VGTSLGLQLTIALCAALVAATLAPRVRRAIPRWFEIALWVALIFVCWIGIASINQPQARELTDAINWAAGQIVATLLGLAGASVLDTMAAHRFAIANAVVTLFGADLIVLALLSTYREGRAWQPQIRLREWMEVPTAAVPRTVAATAGPSAIDELNVRWAAATATASAAAATWSVQFLIWARDVGLPRAEERLALAVAVGRVETKVWLESVRETTRELETTARNFYETSAPEANKLALRVAAILNGVTDAEHRVSPGAANLAQVVDIQALRIAQSLDRFGRAASTDETVEENDPEHTDRLAS
jgi:hypothetical protein